MFENGAICGISKITRAPHSHTRGWAQLWADNLGVPINHDSEVIDKVYLDHGVNFGGKLNLFGGFTDDWRFRLEQIIQAKEVVSLDIDMPDYASMLAARKDVKDDNLISLVRDWQSRARTLRSIDLPFKHLTIGDSHAGAWAPYESCIVRSNGKTLNGQINRDFSYVREHLEMRPDLEKLTLVFGNIDVRFHILRLGADWREMWVQYKKFGDSLDIEVEYALPWPQEFEGRKLPKTGQYKGQNFYGSQQDRAALVNDIVSFCDNIGMNCIKYPAEWCMMDPIEYAKQCMERPQSVHLSPTLYRRMDWGNR
jgi:hypothetical protein